MKKEKQKYCKKCGAEIDLKTKKCIGCGKQYIKLKPMPIIFSIILIVTVISLSSVIIFQNNKINILNNKLDMLNEHETTVEYLLNQYETTTEHTPFFDYKLDEAEKELHKLMFLNSFIAFIIDDDIFYYHNYECDYFKLCNSYKAFTIETAEAIGYKKHSCWYE